MLSRRCVLFLSFMARHSAPLEWERKSLVIKILRQIGFPFLTAIVFYGVIFTNTSIAGNGDQPPAQVRRASTSDSPGDDDEFGPQKKSKLSPRPAPSEKQPGSKEQPFSNTEDTSSLIPLKIELEVGWMIPQLPVDDAAWTCGASCLDTSTPLGLKIINSFVADDPTAHELAQTLKALASSREVQRIGLEMIGRSNWVKNQTRPNQSRDFTAEDLSLVGRLKCAWNAERARIICVAKRLSFGIADPHLVEQPKELKKFAQVNLDYSTDSDERSGGGMPITLKNTDFPYSRGVTASELKSEDYTNVRVRGCPWKERIFFTALAIEKNFSPYSVYEYFTFGGALRNVSPDSLRDFLNYRLERFLSFPKVERNQLKTRIYKSAACHYFLLGLHFLLKSVERFNDHISKEFSIRAKGFPFEAQEYFIGNLGKINLAHRSELNKQYPQRRLRE